MRNGRQNYRFEALPHEEQLGEEHQEKIREALSRVERLQINKTGPENTLLSLVS